MKEEETISKGFSPGSGTPDLQSKALYSESKGLNRQYKTPDCRSRTLYREYRTPDRESKPFDCKSGTPDCQSEPLYCESGTPEVPFDKQVLIVNTINTGQIYLSKEAVSIRKKDDFFRPQWLEKAGKAG